MEGMQSLCENEITLTQVWTHGKWKGMVRNFSGHFTRDQIQVEFSRFPDRISPLFSGSDLFLTSRFNRLNKKLMNSPVRRQLRVKRGGQNAPLPN
jgi:hypothetical protein